MVQWGPLSGWVFGVAGLLVSILSLRKSRAAITTAKIAEERATSAAERAVDEAKRSADSSERTAGVVEAAENRAQSKLAQRTELHEVTWASGWSSYRGSLDWQVWNQGPDDAKAVRLVLDFDGHIIREPPIDVRSGTCIGIAAERFVTNAMRLSGMWVNQRVTWETPAGSRRTAVNDAQHNMPVPAGNLPVQSLEKWPSQAF